MRNTCACLLLWLLALGQQPTSKPVRSPELALDDSVRIREFYHLASSIQDSVWPGWNKVPAPLILVTADTEFLTHHSAPPPAFQKIGDDLYARPRVFPVDLQATMPAFGPPAVIIIGEPAHTLSKTSTPWLFTVMHEHFHQLQWAQPGYEQLVDRLNLSHGDTTGMWMLNYPFPYDKPEVVTGFHRLRDLLLRAVNEKDDKAFAPLAKEYVAERKKWFASLAPADAKYFSFQLWQEGIARYTEVKSAEAGAQYQPTREFAALADYESFSSYAARVRQKTLAELKQADLETWKRAVVYSFGAAEGFLLDRLNPRWKEMYFAQMLSLDGCFEPTCQECSEQRGGTQSSASH